MTAPGLQTYRCAICGVAPLFPSPVVAGDVVCAACQPAYEARVAAAKRRQARDARLARYAGRPGWLR